MPQLKFEGHSDDTFGEYGHFQDDYDCCGSGRAIVYRLTHEGTGLLVYGQYNCSDWPKDTPGCWMIGVQPFDEDNWCGWPIRYEFADSGYSTVLVIDAPDGVKMECVNRQEKD